MPYLEIASPTSLAQRSTLYYQDLTSEQGRPILFLHDWPLDHREWSYPAALFGRGYRVIGVDLPGFGRSDDPGGRITLDTFARSVEALVTVLDLQRVVLVGAGLGATVALTGAIQYPQRVGGLVLVGPLAPRWTNADEFSCGVSRRTVQHLLEETETRWPSLLATYARSLFHVDVGEPTRRWFEQMGLAASLYTVQQSLITLREADLREAVTTIQAPVAVFHGAHDRVAPPELGDDLAHRIPNAELIRFEQSGHAVWMDEPDRFNRALTGFVEGRVYGNTLPPPGVQQLPDGGRRLLPHKTAGARRRPSQMEGATGGILD